MVHGRLTGNKGELLLALHKFEIPVLALDYADEHDLSLLELDGLFTGSMRSLLSVGQGAGLVTLGSGGGGRDN